MAFFKCCNDKSFVVNNYLGKRFMIFVYECLKTGILGSLNLKFFFDNERQMMNKRDVH